MIPPVRRIGKTNKDNTNILQILIRIYRLLKFQQTKSFIKLVLMRIRTGLVPYSKCVISLRLSLEPLSWKGMITQSPLYVGSLTMSGSGIPIGIILPLFYEDAPMRIGG